MILGGGLAQKQVTPHCSQIAASENIQGRHYSRFRPLLGLPRKQYQYLARSKNLKIAKTGGESANFGYRRLDAVDHAFCNAHILRELKSLIEFDHELWAELMRDMLLAANLAVDKARQAGARALPPDQLKALVE